MLNLVPFTGTWRKVAHVNLQAIAIGHRLELRLPYIGFATVAATSIGGDEQFARSWITNRAHQLPPSFDGVDCKNGCVVIDSNIHKPTVRSHVIDAIRDGFRG